MIWCGRSWRGRGAPTSLIPLTQGKVEREETYGPILRALDAFFDGVGDDERCGEFVGICSEGLIIFATEPSYESLYPVRVWGDLHGRL